MMPITELESQNIQNNSKNYGENFKNTLQNYEITNPPKIPKFDINLGVITGLMLIAGVFGFLPLIIITSVGCVLNNSPLPLNFDLGFIFSIVWLSITGIFVFILRTREKQILEQNNTYNRITIYLTGMFILVAIYFWGMVGYKYF